MPSTKGTIWWVSVWSIHLTRFRFRYIVLMWLSGHSPHLWRSPGRRLIQEWFRFTFSSLWPAPTWFSSEGNSAFHSRDSQTPKLHIRLCPFTASFGNPFLTTLKFLGPWLKEALPFYYSAAGFFSSLFVYFMYLNVIVEHFCHKCALYIGLRWYRPHILVNFLLYLYICVIWSTPFNKHDVIGWCKD